jgi:hypothetical protein
MKRAATVLTVLGLTIGSSACLQHTYTLGHGAADAEIVYKHWHHHWLFGLIRPELQQQLDVARLCPSGNVTIHQEMSFANGLVDVLTFFIYTPTTVTVQCDGGETGDVELSADTVARITRDPRFLDYVAEVTPRRLDEARTALAAARSDGDGLTETTATRATR